MITSQSHGAALMQRSGRIRQPRVRIDMRNDRVINSLAFILPYFSLVSFDLVGQLYIIDLVMPLVLIGMLSGRGAGAKLQPIKRFLILIGLWLLGAIITDIYRQTPFEDYARGWAIITLFGVHTATLWLLCARRPAVIALFAFSMGVVSAINAFLFPNEIAASNPLKFGGAFGIVLMIASVGTSTAVRRWVGQQFSTLLVAGVAMVCLLFNARSLFAILALTVAYTMFASWLNRRPEFAARINPLNFLVVVVLGFLLSQVLSDAYGSLAERGVLGEQSRSKYEHQTIGNISLLQGARPESSASFAAIVDSPIIGHGSWAKDPKYLQIYYEHMLKLGLPIFKSFGEYENYAGGRVIPTHSHIFGSWVYSGILGAIPWVWALWFAISALYVMLKSRAVPSVLVSFSAFCLFWDIPFSPFGAEQRIIKAMQICILLSAVVMHQAPVLREKLGRHRRVLSPRQILRLLPSTGYKRNSAASLSAVNRSRVYTPGPAKAARTPPGDGSDV